MSRIEELPDDFDAAVNLTDAVIPTANTSAPSTPATTAMPRNPGAALPPHLVEAKSAGVDEVLRELNRSPLFMTELDHSGEENPELEALRALAYEGTKSEVAGNFREQGNDLAKVKRWEDAREFYDKALAVLREVKKETVKGARLDGGEGPAEVDWLSQPPAVERGEEEEVEDVEAEMEKERVIEEVCFVNRALCNLELKNYRSCIKDCISACTVNPRNIKALYRSSLALLAIDRLTHARDACSHLLLLDPSNTAAAALLRKINARAIHLETVERERETRGVRKALEASTLKQALKERGIIVHGSSQAGSDAQDAVIALEDPVDAKSDLRIPVLLLYPTHAQSDLIKGVNEHESLAEHLNYVLPPGPWDEKGEFVDKEVVECYMETATGGLAKIGKKLKLREVLGSGKMKVEHGLCRVFVVPKGRVEEWVKEFKRRKA